MTSTAVARPATTTALTVRRIRRLTRSAVQIVLDPPTDPWPYRPGQHIGIELELAGRRTSRSYSLTSSAELDDHLAVVVKRVAGGPVSGHLTELLRPGDVLDVRPPQGEFSVVPDRDRERHLVLLGGGSGITPLMAIIRAVLADEPRSRISLVHADSCREEVIFGGELDELRRSSGGRLRVVEVLETVEQGDDALPGRLDAQRTARLVTDLVAGGPPDVEHYLCGPAGLIDVARTALAGLGVPSSRVFTERFTEAAPTGGTASHTARLLADDEDVTTTVPPGGTLLDAAEGAGLLVPSSCRVGDCGTCRGRLVRGRVDSTSVEGLTSADEAAGWILTCVSRPLDDDVVVEFP